MNKLTALRSIGALSLIWASGVKAEVIQEWYETSCAAGYNVAFVNCEINDEQCFQRTWFQVGLNYQAIALEGEHGSDWRDTYQAVASLFLAISGAAS